MIAIVGTVPHARQQMSLALQLARRISWTPTSSATETDDPARTQSCWVKVDNGRFWGID